MNTTDPNLLAAISFFLIVAVSGISFVYMGLKSVVTDTPPSNKHIAIWAGLSLTAALVWHLLA